MHISQGLFYLSRNEFMRQGLGVHICLFYLSCYLLSPPLPSPPVSPPPGRHRRPTLAAAGRSPTSLPLRLRWRTRPSFVANGGGGGALSRADLVVTVIGQGGGGDPRQRGGAWWRCRGHVFRRIFDMEGPNLGACSRPGCWRRRRGSMVGAALGELRFVTAMACSSFSPRLFVEI